MMNRNTNIVVINNIIKRNKYHNVNWDKIYKLMSTKQAKSDIMRAQSIWAGVEQQISCKLYIYLLN